MIYKFANTLPYEKNARRFQDEYPATGYGMAARIGAGRMYRCLLSGNECDYRHPLCRGYTCCACRADSRLYGISRTD